MALQTSGAISNSDVQGEFGGSSPISLSEYYSAATGVPASGNPISLSDFYGKANTVTFTYEIIGGGGGGGNGLDGGSGGTPGGTGGSSSISGSGFTTVTSSGATGGRSGIFAPGSNEAARDGDASYYGSGGARGANTDVGGQGNGSDAPSSSYGAGGGGGGGDFSNNKFDSTGYAGEGGNAATRLTGTITVVSGTTITVTIGGGGGGRFHGTYAGGDGASGFAKITANGTVTNFTSSGTITLTS